MSLTPENVRLQDESADQWATVDSNGNLTVDINKQSLSQVTTTLDDALTSNGGDEVRIDTSPSEPIDASGSEIDVDITSQTLGQVTTTLDDALASNGTDELRIDTSPSEPIDASGSEIDVDINSQTLSNVSVSQSSHDTLNANANIQVADTDVGETNPVPVYEAGDSSDDPAADHQETAALNSGVSETLNFSIAANTTAYLEQVFVSSEVPFTAEVQKFDGTSASTIAFLSGESGDTESFVPEQSRASLFEQANTGSGEEYRVVCTNNQNSSLTSSGKVHVTLESEEE